MGVETIINMSTHWFPPRQKISVKILGLKI